MGPAWIKYKDHTSTGQPWKGTANKGEDFRAGCGTLTEGLRDRVKALEGLACTGHELYRQREEHVLREPWSKAPMFRPVVSKPSRNTARRLRARRQKNLEPTGKQVQGQVRPVEEAEREGGAIEANGSEPSEPVQTSSVKGQNQAARSQDALCVGRRLPPLDLPPGVTPQAAYAWACGHNATPAGPISTGPVCPEQAPAGREDPERADDIKRRSQASRGEGMETSSAAVPLVPLEPGAAPHN